MLLHKRTLSNTGLLLNEIVSKRQVPTFRERTVFAEEADSKTATSQETNYVSRERDICIVA